jgi:hypothetical protein
VLRPLFPIKPAAPVNGGYIVLGDEFGAAARKKKPLPITGIRDVRSLKEAFPLRRPDTLAMFVLDMAFQRVY